MAELETTDMYGVAEFLPHMPKVSGRRALAQRLARRLQTPRGRLLNKPNDGTDMRLFLLSKGPLGRMEFAAQQECQKDEQVEAATVTATRRDDGKTVDLLIEITDVEDETFALTLTVTQAAVSLVDLQESA